MTLEADIKTVRECPFCARKPHTARETFGDNNNHVCCVTKGCVMQYKDITVERLNTRAALKGPDDEAVQTIEVAPAIEGVRGPRPYIKLSPGKTTDDEIRQRFEIITGEGEPSEKSAMMVMWRRQDEIRGAEDALRNAGGTVDVGALKNELRHAVYSSRIPGYKGKSMPIGAEQGVDFAADYLASKDLLK